MEPSNKFLENSSVPKFVKNNKMKIGGEENNKPIVLNNNIDTISNTQNTKERIQFLFPNLPPEDINNVLERAEYNIEKAIILIKEIKEQKNKINTLKNPINQEMAKKREQLKNKIKRNYNSVIQKEKNEKNIVSNIDKTKNINNNQNITHKINPPNNTNMEIKNNNQINLPNNTINNNNISNKTHIDIKSQEKIIHTVQENNLNNNNVIQKKEESELNNNNDSMDENKRNLINAQINFLLGKFSKMTDISELKKLLKDIGFPESKENKDVNENNKLEEELKEKIENNKEEKKFIINQYNKYKDIIEKIKEKEDKIDEFTSTLGNLIDAESEQKMREEEYRNELMEYVKLLEDNNNFNNPREGY